MSGWNNESYPFNREIFPNTSYSDVVWRGVGKTIPNKSRINNDRRPDIFRRENCPLSTVLKWRPYEVRPKPLSMVSRVVGVSIGESKSLRPC